MKSYEDLFNTDPLALMAIAGFVSVLVVTVAVFAWVLTRSDPKRPGKS